MGTPQPKSQASTTGENAAADRIRLSPDDATALDLPPVLHESAAFGAGPHRTPVLDAAHPLDPCGPLVVRGRHTAATDADDPVLGHGHDREPRPSTAASPNALRAEYAAVHRPPCAAWCASSNHG